MRIEVNAERVLVEYEAVYVHFDPVYGPLPPVFICVDKEARFIEFANCADEYHRISSNDTIFQHKPGTFKEGDKIEIVYKKGTQGKWNAVGWEW